MSVQFNFAEKLRWRLKCLESKILQYRLTTNETVVVNTEYGKVKGARRLTVYDDSYFSFEGIPYAQPPIGELRFKAPQRPIPWTDIKDCTTSKEKAVQVQFVLDKVEGSEDCLFLNVYTNNLNPSKPRPVMIFIHGGGFILGEANRDWYGPDYFIQKDVVLVTIQYRLGALGFLSLNSEELNVPGNAGIKDQVMALKWVKNNCASFGGDPNCITVFGQSAGGASTNYLMFTDQAQGLFHRGIMMSGNSLCSWASTDCQKRAYPIAKLAGYTGENNEKDILKFLMSVKAKDLVRLESTVLTPEEREHRVIYAFGPTIETYVTPECIMTKEPREMMKNAWGNSIPIMLGNTSYEGLFCQSDIKLYPNVFKEMETCVNFVPVEIADPKREHAKTIVRGLQIKKTHFRNEKPTADHYMELCSYMYAHFPMHRLIQSRFAYAAGAPIYLYRFDFDSEVIINPFRIMRHGRGVKGVAHGDELTYLFWNIFSQKLPKNTREYRTIQHMINIWTQFATTGKPYDENTDDTSDLKAWEPLHKSEMIYKCLNISDTLKFMKLPEMEKIRCWEKNYLKVRHLLY